EMEDYAGNKSSYLNYLYKKNSTDDVAVDWDDGFKSLINGILANPVSYLAQTNDNSDKDTPSWGSIPGPGSNPFLGHLKFGFNTPYINFLTGFNYAKPDVRQAITWKTIDGNWDAGYNHVGGFNVFSLGSKAVASLEEATGITFDIGFAPNKTADRKGTKYGYWGWVDVKKDDLVVDFQSNGMYDGLLFDDPVEHDFILGVKDTVAAGDGKLSFAVQGLIATHQKDSAEIKEISGSGTADYFGYSTDVFYRSGDFDGIQNFAANVQVGYKAESFGANVEYRMRGAQASMLYLRENHDDGTFDLSETLGVLNSQRIALDAFVKPLDALQINLGVNAVMALEDIKTSDELVQGWINDSGAWSSWYAGRNANDMAPLFGVKGGAEFTFKPAVSYSITDAIALGVYADLNLNTYDMEDGGFGAQYIGEKYSASDSQFRFKKAGLTFNMTPDSDIVKGVNVYYGLDMSNKVRYFNTLVGQVMFPGDVTANLAFGIKTENTASADESFDSDLNNPFAFAVGVSKRFKAMKKPTLYAQFVYNMDPFKHFGDGQDQLNLDRANVKGSWEKEGQGGIDPVDWYDGRAALRAGIRWDI
ncbi:MAG: hypothetical protein SPK26_14785, partial [Treponema sp.]|nr:hypothetical protein [Treponema sp.]